MTTTDQFETANLVRLRQAVLPRATRRLTLVLWGDPVERRARLNAVKAAVREADPLGLVEVGAPDDEYDAEIEDIERRLRPDMTSGEAADVVDEVMRRWFGDQEWAKHRHRSIAGLSKRLSQISSSASP